MDWRNMAAIVLACTALNHLGLIAAVERVIRRSLPVVNCPKCLTFWSALTYQILTGCHPLQALAISLLCSYLAIWLELIMYAIDTLYNRLYGIIEDNNQEIRDEGDTESQ